MQARSERRFLVYGDSNTWGYQPGGGRLPRNAIFPSVAMTVPGCPELVADGQNGRSSVWEHGLFPRELHGGATFAGVLESNLPLQGLVLMLGTNDVMAPLNLSGAQIADNLVRMAWLAKKRCGTDLEIVFLSPPPLAPYGIEELCATGYGKPDILGQNLAHDFELAAQGESFLFLDGSQALAHMDAFDGYHMSREGHRALGELLGHFLARLHRVGGGDFSPQPPTPPDVRFTYHGGSTRAFSN